MLALAREHLAAFEAGAPALPQSLRPAFLPLALTRAYLDRIEGARGHRADSQGADVAAWRKHWLMLRRGDARMGLTTQRLLSAASQSEPLAAVGQRARRDGVAFGDGLVLAAQPLAFRGLRRLDRREQAEIDVHRLEGALARLVVGDDVAAGDVVEQRAEGRGAGGSGRRLAEPLGGGEAPGQQPDRGALDIALAAGDLAGEAQAAAAPSAAATGRAASAN